jgi:hypothetical protein
MKFRHRVFGNSRLNTISQFRENEAIVFLRQFRRFYRNALIDKAAQGAGSIAVITSEITKKVPNCYICGR